MSLVGDAEIRDLNRAYLGKDRPTNVLSFPQHETTVPGGPPGLLGDVVVSADTALRQSATSGLPPEAEVAYLVIHGILHLLGYDHERDKSGARLMRDTQNRLFAEHGHLLASGEETGR